MNDTTTTALPGTPRPLPQEVAHATAIRNTYIWVLVAVGIPGNVACLVTVLSMQATTATLYVAVLAAADSVALVVKLLYHQVATHGKLTDAACTLYHTPSFFSCYANWVLALICFERFFTVFFPLKKAACFSKKRVYLSIVLLIIAMALCFSPTPFFYTEAHSRGGRCLYNEAMRDFRRNFYDFFLLCLYFFAPFLLIVVFTTLIIVGLQRHRRTRGRMSTALTRTHSSDDGSAERSISLMLLGAGLVFLLLTLPACLYYLFLEKTYDLTVLEESAKAFLLYQVICMLSDTNHAVNFVIYFLSAYRFRRRFVGLLKRCFCSRQGEASPTADSSENAIRLTQISQTQEKKDMVDSTPSA